jgi:hypothetical protein
MSDHIQSGGSKGNGPVTPRRKAAGKASAKKPHATRLSDEAIARPPKPAVEAEGPTAQALAEAEPPHPAMADRLRHSQSRSLRRLPPWIRP